MADTTLTRDPRVDSLLPPDGYDPRALGAKCGQCPLGPEGCMRGKEAWRPTPMEHHQDDQAVVVLETPSAEAKLHGRPLAGRAGTEWNFALGQNGLRRPDLSSTYAVACKLPGQAAGAQSRFDKALDRINKRRKAKGKEPHAHPVDCCRPRLRHEVGDYTNIIAAGSVAVKALTGLDRSIQKVRGDLINVTQDWERKDDGERKVFAVMSPDFVAFVPKWRPILEADIGKAFRWYRDELRWVDPEILWRPTPEQLEQWLDETEDAPYDSYDVETNRAGGPTEKKLYSLAIATPDLDAQGRVARPEQGRPIAVRSRAVGLTFELFNGGRHYSPEDESRIKDILVRKYFLNPKRIKVGHNAGFFDRMVIEDHFGCTPAPLWDTLFPTRFRAPDLPKGLKLIGSVLTDVGRWESTDTGESAATGSKSDEDLLLYNCFDSSVNARITAPLIDAAQEAGAFNPLPESLRPPGWANRRWDLWTVDHATQDMCCEMHKAGIWVDQKKRLELEVRFEASVRSRLKNLKKLVGPDFNPNSGPQVRRLFYEDWKLECPPRMESRDFLTETGEKGTGDKVIRGHLASGILNKAQAAVMHEIRLYRRESTKILGTVLRPMNLRSLDPIKGLVYEDGRVRSTWNAHTTAVARLSSSGPNLQNIGNRKGQGPLKGIFAAPPGRIFIGADLDQAHLKIVANYWQIPILQEAFHEGKDPHNTLAYAIFGARFKHADGWGPDGFSLYHKPRGGSALAMRNVMKTFRYASIYKASPDTVWQVLTSTETDDGKMPYLFMEPREVRVFHSKWLKAEPEWADAWAAMVRLYDAQGYMVDPVFGRRSGGLSDGKEQEVVNNPVLTAEGACMRVAEQRIIHAFPYTGDGRGLIHQCHDSVGVEVDLPPGLDPMWRPIKGEPLPGKIEEMRRYVEWAMTVNVPGWDIPITAEADVGRSLKDV